MKKRVHLPEGTGLHYVTCRTCGNTLAVYPSTMRGKDVIRCGVCKNTGTYTYAPIGFYAEPDEDDEDDEDQTEEDEREEIRA